VTASGNRAWIITRDGGFREYTDANNDGFYEKVSPEDEYRILTKTSTGWTLRDLESTGIRSRTRSPSGYVYLLNSEGRNTPQIEQIAPTNSHGEFGERQQPLYLLLRRPSGGHP
jgi:hypothetical protein